MTNAKILDPSTVAASFREELKQQLAVLPTHLHLVGFLTSESGPSCTYANYTKVGCDDVGISFDIRLTPKLALEAAIDAANADPGVHGIIVYYPIFSTERDRYIKDLVDPRKDIEGLHSFWARKLYHNERYVDEHRQRKALLPCTPLAIIKLLENAVQQAGYQTQKEAVFSGQRVTIFNRSEVVGRPLASMLANDGAEVYSFDVDGPLLFRKGSVIDTKISRQDALASSHIVVTGVPSRDFRLISADEIKPGAICINFSTFKNFADDILAKASIFVPRVGPMTVAMALRNTLRLYHNYHAPECRESPS